MKASELMIGDWVLDFDDETVKVASISNEEIRLSQPNGHLYLVSSPKPIPLTEEILKANGWVFRLNDGEYCSPIDISYKEPLRLQIGEDGNAFWWVVGTIIIVPVNYVHELQQALRLCGLNELADNIKV